MVTRRNEGSARSRGAREGDRKAPSVRQSVRGGRAASAASSSTQSTPTERANSSSCAEVSGANREQQSEGMARTVIVARTWLCCSRAPSAITLSATNRSAFRLTLQLPTARPLKTTVTQRDAARGDAWHVRRQHVHVLPLSSPLPNGAPPSPPLTRQTMSDSAGRERWGGSGSEGARR